MKASTHFMNKAMFLIFLTLFSCSPNPSNISGQDSNYDTNTIEEYNANQDLITQQDFSSSDKDTDSLKNHIIDSLLSLSASPYFQGYETPGVLVKTAINLNAYITMFGGTLLIIPTPPSRESYFKDLKAAIALGSVNSLKSSDKLCSFIDDYFLDTEKISSEAGDILKQLSTMTMSAKMKAVRERNHDRIIIFGQLNKLCEDATAFSQALTTFFNSVGTTKECLKLLVRIMEPYNAYAGAENGLRAIYRNSDGLSPELDGALSEVLMLLDNNESTFLINLRNSNSEMFGLITDLAFKLYEENYEHINEVISDLIGEKNFKSLTDFLEERKRMRELFGPIVPADETLNQLVLGYNSVMLENGIHKTIFENLKSAGFPDQKSRLDYLEAFKILLLTESLASERLSSFFSSLPSSFGLASNAEAYDNHAKGAFQAFEALRI